MPPSPFQATPNAGAQDAYGPFESSLLTFHLRKRMQQGNKSNENHRRLSGSSNIMPKAAATPNILSRSRYGNPLSNHYSSSSANIMHSSATSKQRAKSGRNQKGMYNQNARTTKPSFLINNIERVRRAERRQRQGYLFTPRGSSNKRSPSATNTSKSREAYDTTYNTKGNAPSEAFSSPFNIKVKTQQRAIGGGMP